MATPEELDFEFTTTRDSLKPLPFPHLTGMKLAGDIVLGDFKFNTIDEAISLVSDTEYGLSLGILGDVGMAMDIADRVDSGLIHINEQTVADEPNIPFGGVGASGNGSRFGGAEANIEAFTEVQWLTMRSTIAPYPF